MKQLSLRLFVLCIVVFSAGLTVAQTPDPKTALEAGVCAYKNKNYKLAETEFEKSLQRDPANKLLMLFTARAIDFQVDPKDNTPGNLAKARSAINAYSKLLAADPADSEPVSAIVRLYEQIDATKLADIASNGSIPIPVRTAIFIELAAVGNTCANDITDENKTEVKLGTTSTYKYHMPKDPKDLAKAAACTSEGLEFIEKALALDIKSETAWSYKTSLLIQSSRLAEMQQQTAEKAILDKQALTAKAEFTKLADAARERLAQADREEQERWEKERPTAANNLASMAKFIATGRLSRKVTIDKGSIDSPHMEMITAPVDPDQPSQPKADPPQLPIVWKAVTAPDGTFSFVLPSEFDIVRKMYFAKGEGLSFSLFYIDLPAAHPPATPDEIMAGIGSAVADSVCSFTLMANASCDVRLTKKISLGSYPGLEYTVTEDNCIKVLPGLIRVYITPNRVYALAAVGGNETDPRIAKFLNSFAVIK